MNNELRLVLLIAGVIVLAGLYFWGNAAERATRRRDTVRDDPFLTGTSGPRMRPRQDDDELPDFSDLQSLYADSREGIPDAQPVPGVASGPAPAAPAAVPAARSAGIVALHVMTGGDPFRGPEILAAARSADLIYGAMKIFHCYAEGAVRGRERVFSVANVYEPGSFDLENIEQLSTMGVSLFMCLPSPIGNSRGFERMYQAARLFSERLGGTVCGEDRLPLQVEQLAGLRQSLAD